MPLPPAVVARRLTLTAAAFSLLATLAGSASLAAPQRLPNVPGSTQGDPLATEGTKHDDQAEFPRAFLSLGDGTSRTPTRRGA